jgi:hypothetical protein
MKNSSSGHVILSITHPPTPPVPVVATLPSAVNIFIMGNTFYILPCTDTGKKFKERKFYKKKRIYAAFGFIKLVSNN